MKTEQEQIKEIADVLCDYCKNNTKIGEPCKSSNGTYICTSEIRRATAIVQAGYGDVSEYKAEIEDLKDEIIYLERKIAIRDNALKDSDKAIEMLEGKQDTIVKQAKIDVLNELKKKAWQSHCSFMHIVNTEQIDELVKEIRAQ